MNGPRSRTVTLARRVWLRRTAAPLAMSALILGAGLGGTRAAEEPAEEPAIASANSLRIDPPTQTVAQNGSFTVHVIQTADVPTSGAAATITFDPTVVQIQTVRYGPAYAEATVFSGASPIAITAANTTGSLVGVAAAFTPPGAVPPGEADFLDVTFGAIGCGTVSLGLPTGVADATLLDGREATYGNALPVSTIGGSVTTCVDASPSPSGEPGGSAGPSAPPSPSATPRTCGTGPDVPAGNSIRVEPYCTAVADGGTFTVRLVQRATVPTSGAAATITFDPALVRIQGVAKGDPYAEAPVFSGATSIAIAAANTTGSLVGVAAAFTPPDSIPSGDADFLAITFQAIGCGTVALGLPTGVRDAAILDASAATYGEPLALTTRDGRVETCVEGGPSQSSSPSGAPSGSPSASPAVRTCGTGPALPSGNSIRIAPYCTGVVANGGFAVRVVQRATVPTSGITASIVFDRTILQVVSITRSSAFATAPIYAGAGSSAIAAANASGKLNQVAVSFLPPANVPAGEVEFITVEFKAIACGESKLELPSVSTDSAILDGREASYGIPLAIRAVSGTVQACDPEATPTPQPTPTPTAATAAPGQGTGVTPVPTPPDTGGQPPAESAAPGEPAPAAPGQTASPLPVDAGTDSRPAPSSPAMSNVAFVGLGVAAVIGGLVVVLLMAAALAAGFVVPLVVVRVVGRGRRQ